MKMRMRRRTLSLLGLAFSVLVLAWLVLGSFCVSAWWRYGMVVSECPDGRPRQTVALQAERLLRGGEHSVARVTAQARYMTRAGSEDTAPVRSFEPSLFLVDGAGKETPLAPKDGWQEREDDSRVSRVALPAVPDGDYRLRARIHSKLGEDTVEVPLALYAPARIHVLTDRPLYEPGNTVQFRALVLRAKDLSPLDGRPGLWRVLDPSGEVVLEEKAPAGAWGVVAGGFPLDRGAPTGDWKVRWSSGDASDEVSFRVEPFTLPRFRVEAEPSKPFYRPGDAPVLRGKVVFSSGAPVAGARLSITWSNSGEWPPPTAWLSTLLPRQAVSGPDGTFTLNLPRVPEDLRKQVTLSARLEATDPTGDRVEGGAAVLLSEDALQVSAVTELAEGLAEGFNNRVYLRATTAAGRALPGAMVKVRRAWDPKDPGVEALADEDGVASFQLDPGAPVNVVIPPMPLRPPPRQRAVSRSEATELLGGEEPRLADQTAMDAWVAALEPCAKWSNGGSHVTLALKVGAEGAITAAASQGSAVETCALEVIRARRLPPGPTRLYRVAFDFSDNELPRLSPSVESALEEQPEGLDEALGQLVLGARDCVPESVAAGRLPRAVMWQARKGSKEVALSWDAIPDGERALAQVAACAQGRLPPKLTLPEPASADGLGLAHLEVEPSPRMSVSAPQATTMLGYELRVSARLEGKEVGATKLVLQPGQVPPVRLRASNVLAQAGDAVDVELLRGPGFPGALPQKLMLLIGHEALEAKLDPQTRVARFTLPPDAEGWGQVEWGGARTIVYVKPKARLEVELSPDKERYAPGQLARLNVRTVVGGKGGPAAVGLVGVDESLSQLAPLPGAEELSRVRPKVAMSSPSFGVLDGQALAMGHIRGKNAAAATVLRVTSVPTAAELEPELVVGGASTFDPSEELTDRFYGALEELHAQARAWEESAPKGEQATPKLVATLWGRALDACEKRGQPVTDAFGRRLKLSRLPPELLALADPREVVRAKTRLPEDVENWQAWVAKEEP